eukprot:1158625-Pelagomonas_calceolata.AAC.3
MSRMEMDRPLEEAAFCRLAARTHRQRSAAKDRHCQLRIVAQQSILRTQAPLRDLYYLSGGLRGTVTLGYESMASIQ